MATVFLLLIYLAFISLGLPDSMLGAAWPVMRQSFAASLDLAGVVSLVISAGTILSSLASGRVVGRFGTGRVTAVSVLLTSAALFGMGMARSVGWLVLMAVPLGLGAGAVDAALNNYVALHYRPLHMNWLHCFWGVGALGGPLILAVFLGQDIGWRGGYFAVAGIQFVVFLLLLASLPLWKSRGGAAVAEQTPPTGAGISAAGGALRAPGVVPALLTFFVYCAGEYILGLWGASFLVEQRAFTEAAAATAVSVYYFGITAGRFLSGILSVRLSGQLLIRAGTLVFCVGAVLLFWPLGGVLAYAPFLLAGLGYAPVYPAMIQETPRRFGAEHSQKIIGWQMAAAYTGTTAVPPLVGLAAQRLGMQILPFVVLGLGAALLVFSEWITRAVAKGRAA